MNFRAQRGLGLDSESLWPVRNIAGPVVCAPVDGIRSPNGSVVSNVIACQLVIILPPMPTIYAILLSFKIISVPFAARLDSKSQNQTYDLFLHRFTNQMLLFTDLSDCDSQNASFDLWIVRARVRARSRVWSLISLSDASFCFFFVCHCLQSLH